MIGNKGGIRDRGLSTIFGRVERKQKGGKI